MPYLDRGKPLYLHPATVSRNTFSLNRGGTLIKNRDGPSNKSSKEFLNIIIFLKTVSSN